MAVLARLTGGFPLRLLCGGPSAVAQEADSVPCGEDEGVTGSGYGAGER
ncbi:hypothetical protein F750_0956 [Streptomyces sp. PAMC 26508]|nr:hypothetical protein F750_0956 [Streptomyces sp. PAMC 26508]